MILSLAITSGMNKFSKSYLDSSGITCNLRSGSSSLNYLPTFFFLSPSATSSSGCSAPSSAFLSNIEPTTESVPCSRSSINWWYSSAAINLIFLSVVAGASYVCSDSSLTLDFSPCFANYTPVALVYSFKWSATKFKSSMMFSLFSKLSRNTFLLSVISLAASWCFSFSCFANSWILFCSSINSECFLNCVLSSVRLVLLWFWFRRWFAI